MKRAYNLGVIAVLLAGIIVLAAVVGWNQFKSAFAPAAPETIVSASLDALKEQNVLVPFTARFVADPTSRVRKLGLTAQKTLIVPGTVRYELDLGTLTPDNLAWDAAAGTLTVTLPPLTVSTPEMDPAGAVEYRDGALVMAVTDAEKLLDEANWKAAREEITAQAKGATPMKLAQGAAVAAVRSNFALPLKAAGVDATVNVRFAE